MNEIELSNKNGIPVTTVGELKELLLPFMDECPINEISVFYTGSGYEGAKLSIRPCNTQMQAVACKCNPAEVGWLETLKGRLCSVCGELRR